MAVCPWCKLAVGSQVVRMTVIDVQVFGSSNTETPEPQHTCVRSFTLVMHTHTHKSIQPTLGVKRSERAVLIQRTDVNGKRLGNDS